jgi:hypothetical protein
MLMLTCRPPPALIFRGGACSLPVWASVLLLVHVHLHESDGTNRTTEEASLSLRALKSVQWHYRIITCPMYLYPYSSMHSSNKSQFAVFCFRSKMPMQ